ncbi:MAG: DUF4296 domain-containing protein [Duncaniella sp.]|nr:DUF4296 domain-containing protein [Duncaniella sp.]
MRHLPSVLFAALLLVMMACSRTPDYVIPKDKMAQLMADVYLGDAVVDNNSREYNTDSLRRVLMQSIYLKHGVTSQQVDTSLDWYGHHVQVYIEMCNLTEEILQKRIDAAERAGGKSEKAPRLMSLDGDSVDVWTGIRNRRNTSDMASDFIAFNIASDKNWERGDRYTLSVKGLNTRRPVTLALAVDYNDGSTEFKWFNGPAEGMNRLLLVLDSAKVASSVYGSIHYAGMKNEISYLDSITLVRTRGRDDNVSARTGQTVVKNR